MSRMCAVVAIVLLLSSVVFDANAYANNGWRTAICRGENFISSLRSNLSRKAISVIGAATIFCTAYSCANNTVTTDIQSKGVVRVDYDREASLNEMVAAIEQVEGAQIGIVHSVDQESKIVKIVTDDGTTYF